MSNSRLAFLIVLTLVCALDIDPSPLAAAQRDAAAHPAVMPSEAAARPDVYAGKHIEWIGLQIRTSRRPRDAPSINSRLFVMVDDAGHELAGQMFAVEGVATETRAAQRARHFVRRVRGTFSGVVDPLVNGQHGAVVPQLTDVSLDVP